MQRPHRRRLLLRHAVVAWVAVGAMGVAPFVTPGVRHAHVESVPPAVPATPSIGDDAKSHDPVVVYRRRGALSRRLRSQSAESTGNTAVAHHAASSPDLSSAHAHDGSADHVHYSFFGIDFSLPAAGSTTSSIGTTMLAHGEGSARRSEGGATKDRPVLGLALVAPERAPAPNGDSAPQTFYRRTLPVELPTVDGTTRFTLADARVTNPDLDGDDPVPRPPRA